MIPNQISGLMDLIMHPKEAQLFLDDRYILDVLRELRRSPTIKI